MELTNLLEMMMILSTRYHGTISLDMNSKNGKLWFLHLFSFLFYILASLIMVQRNRRHNTDGSS